MKVLADHGAFNATAQPTKFPAGFFHVFTGSYDLEAAHCEVTGVYTNKAPGGVAYACSFRITEAVYLVERMVDVLAAELGKDPAELRLQNFIKPEQFPYEAKTGWVYDSGDYETTMRKALDIAGYDELRREQAEKRERGELMGIGVAFFTETVGAGPRKHMDIAGLGMNDGAELRVHPTGKAVLRISVQTQGQGHETTFAQIVGRGARDPGRRTSTSCTATPTRRRSASAPTGAARRRCPGAAAAVVGAQDPRQGEADRGDDARGGARRPRVGEGPLLRPRRPGAGQDDPGGRARRPRGLRAARRASRARSTPRPSTTRPTSRSRSAATSCVVDVDPGTGQVKVRRFIAVDDCGPRINPMIVEGQIHGGLADGVGMALMQQIAFDEDGNCLSGSFMDYLLPTVARGAGLGARRDRDAVAAPPDRRQGRGRVRDGGLAAVRDQRGRRRALAARACATSTCRATPARVWAAMQGRAEPPA